jgi:hypothetical protein
VRTKLCLRRPLPRGSCSNLGSAAFEGYSHTGKKWDELGAKEELGENGAVLSEIARGRDRPKKKPSKEFALKLIRYCKAREGFHFSDTILEGLHSILEPSKHALQSTEELENRRSTDEQITEKQEEARPRSFISALGLKKTIAEKSIDDFSGHYLHFGLNDKDEIVTTKCCLSSELGEDEAPIFSSSRHYPDEGILQAAGAYFCFERNLYLLASPIDSVDLRLSVFNVIPRSRQNIIRGMVLGVTRTKTILSSRCVLVTADRINEAVLNQLYEKPCVRAAFAKISDEFSEISTFLFGEETVETPGS